MASLSLCIFFQNAQQNIQSHVLIIMICELKQCLMKLFRWANICIWPQHYDIFLYLVEMPKIPNFLHLQVQITSGALRVSKFWSRERRLFAWQIKPHNLYLGTVYIAHREVKDLPRFQGHLENRTSYDTGIQVLFITWKFCWYSVFLKEDISC